MCILLYSVKYTTKHVLECLVQSPTCIRYVFLSHYVLFGGCGRPQYEDEDESALILSAFESNS